MGARVDFGAATGPLQGLAQANAILAQRKEQARERRAGILSAAGGIIGGLVGGAPGAAIGGVAGRAVGGGSVGGGDVANIGTAFLNQQNQERSVEQQAAREAATESRFTRGLEAQQAAQERSIASRQEENDLRAGQRVLEQRNERQRRAAEAGSREKFQSASLTIRKQELEQRKADAAANRELKEKLAQLKVGGKGEGTDKILGRLINKRLETGTLTPAEQEAMKFIGSSNAKNALFATRAFPELFGEARGSPPPAGEVTPDAALQDAKGVITANPGARDEVIRRLKEKFPNLDVSGL